MPGIIIPVSFGNSSLVNSSVSQAEKDVFNISGLMKWVEFAPGLLSADRTKLYDRKTYGAYAVSGAITQSVGALQSVRFADAPGSGGTAGTFPLTIGAPPAGGVQAVGTFTVTGGVITAATVTTPGSGYLAPPAVSAPGAGLAGAALVGVLDTIGGQPTGVFTGAQSVDMGNDFPVNAHYTQIVVAQGNFPAGLNRALLGGKGGASTFRGLYSTGGSDRIRLTQSDGSSQASVDIPQNRTIVRKAALIIQAYNESTKAAAMYVNGVLIATPVVGVSNTDAGLLLGNIPAASGTFFQGSIAAVLLIAGDLASRPVDLAVVTNYLKSKYGL